MKISIITICYNAADVLERTMLSVLNQTYADIEYIVVDGGSKDGSKDIIQRHAHRLAHWVSEPDNGIYHAMNKGTRMATGDFCLYMNAGDYMASPRAVEWAVPLLQSGSICVGGAVITKGGRTESWNYAPAEPTLWFFYTGSICHQSTFIPRRMLLEYPYDESLAMVSDWKYWMEHIVLRGCPYVAIPVTISICNKEGITYTQLERGRAERRKVEAQLIPQRILSDYYQRMHTEYPLARFWRRMKACVQRHWSVMAYHMTIQNPNRPF